MNTDSDRLTELVSCPHPRNGVPCTSRGTRSAIEAHLVEQHLLSPPWAKQLLKEQETQKVLQQTQKTVPPPIPVVGPAHTSAEPPHNTAEAVMPDLSKPVDCKGCRKSYVRKGNRQKYCDACSANTCTVCHRRAGQHNPKCTKGGGKRDTKKAVRDVVSSKIPEGRIGRTAAYIRGLIQCEKAGQAATKELAAIRAELGG
jgi:hypothetical protein